MTLLNVNYKFLGCVSEDSYSSIPGHLYSEDESILKEALKEAPLIGLELEYDLPCYSSYCDVEQAFTAASVETKLPFVICEDDSLKDEYGREFNLAPGTFGQVNRFCKRLTGASELYRSASRGIHGETGMHIHFSHNLDGSRSDSHSQDSKTFFNTKEALMLFSILANSSQLNRNLQDKYSVYNRAFNRYSSYTGRHELSKLFKLCIQNEELVDAEVIRTLNFYHPTGASNAGITRICHAELDHKDIYNYLRYNCSGLFYGISCIRENTLEWRAFRTPKTYGGFNKALAAAAIFLRFCNTKQDLLKVEDFQEDTITRQFDRIDEEFYAYFGSRFERYRNLFQRLA